MSRDSTAQISWIHRGTLSHYARTLLNEFHGKKKTRNAHLDLFKKGGAGAENRYSVTSHIAIPWPHRHWIHWPIGLTGHAFFWSGWMVEQGFIDVTEDRRPTPSDVHNKPIGSKSGCPQVDSGCSWKMLFATCTFWTELSFDKRATSMPKSWQSHQSNTRWCIRQRLEDAYLHALCRAKPLSRRYLWCCNPAGGWHLDWSWAKPQGFTIQVAKPLKFLHMSVSKNDEWMTIDHIWHHIP